MGFDDYPTLQGEYLSFAEIKPVLSIGGLLDIKTKDFSDVSFDDELVPSLVRGTGPGVRGRTVGIYSANATISMYQASAVAFRAALLKAANLAGHNKIGLVKFDLPIIWSPLDGIGLLYQTNIKGARLQGRSQKNSANSADPNVSEMAISVVRIEEIDPTTGNVIVLC